MIAYKHCTPYIQVEVKSIRSMSVCNRRRARRVELVRPRAGSNWSVGVDGCVCVCLWWWVEGCCRSRQRLRWRRLMCEVPFGQYFGLAFRCQMPIEVSAHDYWSCWWCLDWSPAGRVVTRNCGKRGEVGGWPMGVMCWALSFCRSHFPPYIVSCIFDPFRQRKWERHLALSFAYPYL